MKDTLRDLERRLDRLEKNAGLLDFFDSTKRQIKREEKELEKQISRERDIDFVKVSIDPKGTSYKNSTFFDMTLEIVYLGSKYLLSGSREVRGNVKELRMANPLAYSVFRQNTNRSNKNKTYRPSDIRSISTMNSVSYKVFFPKERSLSVRLYPKGHKLYSRSQTITDLFEMKDSFFS